MKISIHNSRIHTQPLLHCLCWQINNYENKDCKSWHFYILLHTIFPQFWTPAIYFLWHGQLISCLFSLFKEPRQIVYFCLFHEPASKSSFAKLSLSPLSWDLSICRDIPPNFRCLILKFVGHHLGLPLFPAQSCSSTPLGCIQENLVTECVLWLSWPKSSYFPK